MVLICNSNGQPIHTVDEWLRYAPPKEGRKQWKDGRSAKELAKAWCRPNVPFEIVELFNSNSFTRELTIESAVPEKKISLDDYKEETRNGDLVLVGHVPLGKIVIGIEAKADEEFGPIIKKYLKEKRGTNSNVPRRIALLKKSIFKNPDNPMIDELRYQLLHGLAGTLIEAKRKRASFAAFVVHEFRSTGLDAKKVKRNAEDFEKFTHIFVREKDFKVSPFQLYGPIEVPGGKFVPKNIRFLIGKVITSLS